MSIFRSGLSVARPKIDKSITGPAFTGYNEVKRFRKYRVMPRKEFRNFDFVTGVNYTLYLDLIPNDVYALVYKIFMESTTCENRAQLYDYLGQWGNYAKYKRDELHVLWYCLIDLRSLMGYNYNQLDLGEIKTMTKDWINKKSEYKLPGIDWHEAMKVELRELFSRCGGRLPEVTLNLDEFIFDRDLWGTGGASHLLIKEKIAGVPSLPKTKHTIAYTYKTNELMNEVKYGNIQRNKVVEKRDELGKRRLIITSSDAMYLNMSYVSYYLESLLRNTPSLYMTYDADERHTMWEQFTTYANRINVPLDQESFDHQKSMKYICTIIDAIEEFLLKYDLPDDVYNCIDRIRYGIENAYVEFSDGETLKVMSGILSGWRWTALFDSLGNYCDVRIPCRLLNIKPVIHISMGDDSGLVMNSENEAYSLIYTMQRAGIVINPRKFWVGRKYNEFLRKFITFNNSIKSYPARMVSRLCWRSPLSQSTRIGESKPYELCDNWLAMSRRGVKWCRIFFHMVNDISRAMSYVKAVVIDWLFTARTLGGGGLGVNTITAAEIKPKFEPEYGYHYMGAKEVADSLGINLPVNPLHPIKVQTEFVPAVSVDKVVGHVCVRPITRSFRVKYNSKYLTLRNAYISHLVRLKNWEGIRNNLDDSVLHIYDILVRRASRNVLIDWLLDKLPYKNVLHNYGPELNSAINEDFFSYNFYRLINRSKITRIKMMRNAYLSEHQLHQSSVNFLERYVHDT